PCDGIKAPSAEQSRDRALSDDELRLAWRAADALDWPFGHLVKLLILTGQRRDEVSEMRGAEGDFATKLWTIPKERAKNGNPAEVPLSSAAVAVLAALPKIASKQRLVFSTNGETSITGFSRAKTRLDAILTERNEAEPLPHWTFHDLRRTVASGLAKLGV